jgi:hypothetical protein
MDPTQSSTFAAEVIKWKLRGSQQLRRRTICNEVVLTMMQYLKSWCELQVYAVELGHTDAPDDQRLGFAEQMVKGLFWHWAQKSQHATSDSRPVLDPHRCCNGGTVEWKQA